MKTSKIIFLSFFGLWALVLLSFLIQTPEEKIAARRHAHIISATDEKVEIEPFTHFVNNGVRVNIYPSDFDYIAFFYEENKELVKPEFSVENNSLTITQTDATNIIYIDLYASRLTSIENNNARLDVKFFGQAALNITGKGGNISLHDIFVSEMFTANLTDCELNCHSSGNNIAHNNKTEQFKQFAAGFENSNDLKPMFASVNMKMNNSRCRIHYGKLPELRATLENKSELNVNKVLTLDVKTDDSSRFYSR